VTAPSYDAVLLLSFGGPEGPDDVMPFLRNVTRGRGVPEDRLVEVSHHYLAYGGVSPINAQNRALRQALSDELAARGSHLPVLWGNRNWDPYLADTLRAAHAAGHRRLLALVTSAYAGYSSCRQYREDLARALEETGLGDELTIDKVRPFYDLPGFVEPFARGVRAALPRAGQAPARTHVLFVTHSIPTAAAEQAGPPGRRPGGDGVYAAQHRAVAQAVMDQAVTDRAVTDRAVTHRAATDQPATDQDQEEVSWSLAYQSRSGAPSTPWLEPDVNDAIRDLAVQGVRAVVLVPIGFVSDHLEVLWDLDEEAVETASGLGLHVERVATPGVDQAFVAGLVDLVAQRCAVVAPTAGERGAPLVAAPFAALRPTSLDAPSLCAIGRWEDSCLPGCCANPRAPRPVAASAVP